MEQNTPKLSVVIPVYNAEKYIVRTLTTLEKQTVGKDEYRIILVDDGSKDNTLAICNQFAEKFANIQIVQKENGGVSSARNAGIAVATGKWIAFVDSDDYVDENYVEMLLNTSPDADYVIFDNFLEQGKSLIKEKEWLQPFFDQNASVSKVMLWVCDNRLNAPWDKRFSLDVIKKNHIQFPNGINMGEDLLFNFEYVLYASTAFASHEAIYIHTDNLNGLCKQRVTEKRLVEYEAIYKMMMTACREKHIENICGRVINLAFLRNISKCAGQLYASGFSKKYIAECFCRSDMVQSVLAEPAVLLKDKVRKFLLRMRLYKLCMQVFE